MQHVHNQSNTLREIVGIAASHAGADTCLIPHVGSVGAAKAIDALAILHASAHPTEEAAKALLATRQMCAIITKNPSLEGADPAARQGEAVTKFLATLATNRRTTRRLKHFFSKPLRFAKKCPHVSAVLSSARLEMFKLLGQGPSDRDWEAFERAKVFSKGTVQGIAKGRFTDVDPYAKLSRTQTFTGSRRALLHFGPMLLHGPFRQLLQEYALLGQLKVGESDCSEATCVPKDASVDRFIAIEPMLNAMAQQGIRAMLDVYLRRWGITLTDQSENVRLAKIASMKGFAPNGFATIDLSSASDTITEELLRYLLPAGWFDLLDAARTHTVRWDGEVLATTSFSTMGNAFTFPLQCLIFSSMVKACIRLTVCEDTRWKVYGDDIILPLSASMLLMEVLRFSGFTPNETKSFVVGHFRESCGGDYLGGYDVRPVYLKEDVTKLVHKHQFFNALQRKNRAHPVLPYLYNTVKRPLVGPAIGPAGGETSHFVAPTWYLRKRRLCFWNTNTQSYQYRYSCLVGKSRKRHRKTELVSYLCSLLGSHGRWHDIRGSQRHAIEVRHTTTPWIMAGFAPLWYNL